jgi:hypothetical protein
MRLYWKQTQDFVELFHVAGRHIGENLEGGQIFSPLILSNFYKSLEGKGR